MLIDKDTLWSWAAAAKEPDKVLVFNSADNVDFIVEISCPVPVIEEQPFHSNISSIWKNPL